MMQVRRMMLEDLSQVVSIEIANFSRPWTENGFATYLDREDGLFLVAEEGEEILGYIGLIMVPDEGDITNVSVKKEAQGKGIGKALVREIILQGKAHGVNKIYLEVRAGNAPAIGLYSKMGFVRDGLRKRYYEAPVEDAILMSRREEDAF